MIGVLLYWITATLLVPTRDFLLDHLIAETIVVQKASHMQPKWHVLNDNLNEMVIVGKETV